MIDAESTNAKLTAERYYVSGNIYSNLVKEGCKDNDLLQVALITTVLGRAFASDFEYESIVQTVW